MSLAQALLSLLGTIAGIVAVILNRRYDASARRETDLAQARRELAWALATKRYTEAAFWARRLQTLGDGMLSPPPVAAGSPMPAASPTKETTP
jgi:hypothetical protein